MAQKSKTIPEPRRIVEYNRSVWIWECQCRNSGHRATKPSAKSEYEEHWRKKHQ